MASGSKTVIYAALFGNMAIAVTKFAASVMTGSSAMLTEAIHSVVDTGNQAVLLYGLKKARQPPDDRFPLGHGKEIYFWSFVVAILIFAVGAGVSVYEGIKHILHPVAPGDPTINYIVLGLAMVFEGGAWYMAFREFRRIKADQGYIEAIKKGKDPTVFVVLFEDSAALLGLFVAFLGIALGRYTGLHWLDGAASVLIGLILAGVAVWLAFETKGLLIGEAAAPEVRRKALELLEAHPNIDKVNELLTLHMGPQSILILASADFDNSLNASEVESSVTDLKQAICGTLPGVARVFIQVESDSKSP